MKILYRPPDDVQWINVDDPVMGGVSSSTTRVVEVDGKPRLRFAGEVSLENNGGFCSTRTEGTTWHCEAADHFEVTLRGDGKDYKFTVRTDDHDSGGYRVRFQTTGERETHTFAVDDFEFYRRGTHFPDAPGLDPATIQSIGFLVSDGQEGEFELDVFEIGLLDVRHTFQTWPA